HLQAFVWLRWRLFKNQLKKGGTTNAVILTILAVFLVLLGVFLFFGLFLAGWLALPGAPRVVLLFVWDGLVLAFLFSWATGLVAELQRSEVLSLEKFLHLPVSLTGAFLINYLSSLFSLTMLIFLPAMLGLALGMVFAEGPIMLLLLPLLAAFL